MPQFVFFLKWRVLKYREKKQNNENGTSELSELNSQSWTSQKSWWIQTLEGTKGYF